MKILLIDNYDSFTFNLYQYIGELLGRWGHGDSLEVCRNNEINLEKIKQRKYDKIIISPGPGSPDDPAYFGICGKVITEIGQHTPVLGVCLGMQGIAHHFGGKVVRAELPMHGKTSTITHDGQGLFRNLPQHIEIMRYHSLIADKASLPEGLIVTATTTDESQEIMGIRHTVYPIEGVQFHPESFASEGGKQLLTNFLTA
jgi:anthranilate synthase component 2